MRRLNRANPSGCLCTRAAVGSWCVMSIGVLFVCMGNICRSPTAHGVFQYMVAEAGLVDRIRVDSVPDPYFGSGEEGFEHVLDLVETASAGLLEHLRGELSG